MTSLQPKHSKSPSSSTQQPQRSQSNPHPYNGLTGDTLNSLTEDTLSPEVLVQLQHTIGNQATLQLLSRKSASQANQRPRIAPHLHPTEGNGSIQREPYTHQLGEGRGTVSIDNERSDADDAFESDKKHVRGMRFRYEGLLQQVHWLQTLQLFLFDRSGRYLEGKLMFIGGGDTSKDLSTLSNRKSYVDAGHFDGSPFMDMQEAMTLTDPHRHIVGFFDPPLEGEGRSLNMIPKGGLNLPDPGTELLLTVEFLTHLVTLDDSDIPEDKLITVQWRAQVKYKVVSAEQHRIHFVQVDSGPLYTLDSVYEHRPGEKVLGDADHLDAYKSWLQGVIGGIGRQVTAIDQKLGVNQQGK